MSEDAKHAADQNAEQKSGQEQEVAEKPEVTDEATVETKSDSNTSEDSSTESKTDDATGDSPEDATSDSAKETLPKVTLTVEKVEDAKAESDTKDDNIEIEIALDSEDTKKSEDFQQSVREQIENCKFEIISSVQDSVHDELRGIAKELRRQNRRRRVGFILRDIIILVLAAALGYAIYCLYDAQYFDFMKPQCEREGTCVASTEPKDDAPQVAEVVKDTAWYINNYGYLYDALQLNLNADKVSAYYLYSGDYRVQEIQPNYLLGMAYNVLNSNTTYDSANGIVIPSIDLRTAFVNLFGTADYFVKENFVHGCVDFEYDRASDSFITPAVQCVSNANREIVEQITEAHEEGNAMYFITTAAIYDRLENAFYSFDNLFRPVAQNTKADELLRYQAILNQYQYRFKKVDNKYYFSDITKLR